MALFHFYCSPGNGFYGHASTIRRATQLGEMKKRGGKGEFRWTRFRTLDKAQLMAQDVIDYDGKAVSPLLPAIWILFETSGRPFEPPTKLSNHDLVPLSKFLWTLFFFYFITLKKNFYLRNVFAFVLKQRKLRDEGIIETYEEIVTAIVITGKDKSFNF